MTEREGTPEDFARMMRGENPEPESEPKPDQDPEPRAEAEQVVAELFGRSPERQEAEREFLDSLHRPYTEDDAA